MRPFPLEPNQRVVKLTSRHIGTLMVTTQDEKVFRKFEFVT